MNMAQSPNLIRLRALLCGAALLVIGTPVDAMAAGGATRARGNKAAGAPAVPRPTPAPTEEPSEPATKKRGKREAAAIESRPADPKRKRGKAVECVMNRQ